MHRSSGRISCSIHHGFLLDSSGLLFCVVFLVLIVLFPKTTADTEEYCTVRYSHSVFGRKGDLRFDRTCRLSTENQGSR